MGIFSGNSSFISETLRPFFDWISDQDTRDMSQKNTDYSQRVGIQANNALSRDRGLSKAYWGSSPELRKQIMMVLETNAHRRNENRPQIDTLNIHSIKGESDTSFIERIRKAINYDGDLSASVTG